MDFSGIIGLAAGIILVLFGITFDQDNFSFIFKNLESFVDVPSIAIVVGGTMGALLLAYPFSMFAKIPKHLKIIVMPTKYDPIDYISQLVEFAKEARMKGLLSLEDKLNETNNAFLKNSLMLVVDSIEAEKVKLLLETELDYLDERHSQSISFYERAAAFSPGFGMIGTLIGLINMLKDMNPDTIGASMSVALITTFYGSILANMLFTPIGSKLKARHDEEYLCKMIICEGVMSIQAGENPRFIEEKLRLLLPSNSRGIAGEERDGAEQDGGKKPKKEKKSKNKDK